MSDERDIGTVTCPYDGKEAAVRKNKRGRLYVVCPGCGVDMRDNKARQEWILANGKFPTGKPKLEPDAAPAPKRQEATPADESEPKSGSSGSLDVWEL